MQDFCLQICKSNDIQETLQEREILMPRNTEAWFRQLVQREGTDESYRRLSQGPRQRTDRKPRILKDGTRTDI